MRLLFYSPQFLPSTGGLQNVVHYWAEMLTKKGHEVVVLCQTPGTDRLGSYAVFRKSGFVETVKLMRKADLVIMFNVSLKAMPQWFLSGKPLLISHHTAHKYDDEPPTWQQRLKRLIANRIPSANFACSAFIARDYKNCFVIRNPYDDRIFDKRSSLKIPNSILFVGRLVSDKGADLLISAFESLQKKQRKFPLRLTLIGSGPQEQALRLLAEQANLQDSVHFAGALSPMQTAALMSQYQVLAIPSRLEPFGIVALEGLACGCEIVCSEQGGLPEAALNFAHYFSVGSVDELATCIETALQKKKNIGSEEHLRQFTLQNSANMLEVYLGQFVNQLVNEKN